MFGILDSGGIIKTLIHSCFPLPLTDSSEYDPIPKIPPDSDTIPPNYRRHKVITPSNTSMKHKSYKIINKPINTSIIKLHNKELVNIILVYFHYSIHKHH